MIVCTEGGDGKEELDRPHSGLQSRSPHRLPAVVHRFVFLECRTLE